MSTRTSIPIRGLIEGVARERLKGYELTIHESTHQSLLYGYRGRIAGYFNCFVLYQASRSFGRITAEVAISRADELPIYRWTDDPRLGVAGFRERVQVLHHEVDKTSVYSSQQELATVLLDLTKECEVAVLKLADQVIEAVAEEYRIWQPLFSQWQRASQEHPPQGPDQMRFPGLEGEDVAREVIHDTLARGTFDRFLGPKKFKYRDDEFFDCHVYLLAKALEFIEPPPLPPLLDDEERETEEIDPQDKTAPLPDAYASLTGRQPVAESVELAVSTSLRTTQWTFLRSFAALEAFYGRDGATAVRPSEFRTPNQGAQPTESDISLDELYEGIMGNEAYSGPAEAQPPKPAEKPAENPAPPEPEPEKAQASAKAKQPERPDPFEMLGDYIGQEEPDPFDVLGEQLGL